MLEEIRSSRDALTSVVVIIIHCKCRRHNNRPHYHYHHRVTHMLLPR